MTYELIQNPYGYAPLTAALAFDESKNDLVAATVIVYGKGNEGVTISRKVQLRKKDKKKIVPIIDRSISKLY